MLELNASDDRGIGVIRNKVKKFAEQIAQKNPNKQFICPGYKIIILDEADSMTTEAQGALRRIIEDYSGNTRFCIICNYITKIIEPLASRCIKYRFKAIPINQQISRLTDISSQEHVRITEPSLRKLVQVSDGDLRKSINMLQSASILYSREVNEDRIYEISGMINQDIIDELEIVITSKQFKNVQDYKNKIIQSGYNVE